MLATVKKALRVSTTHFDDEIKDLIDAGKSDLRLAGVFYEYPLDALDTDPLIRRAIITYVKSSFGYDNPEAERFQQSYVMLKQHLCLAGDYNAPLD